MESKEKLKIDNMLRLMEQRIERVWQLVSKGNIWEGIFLVGKELRRE